MNNIPEIGAELFGFKVISVEPYPFRENAWFITMEHLRSGASLLYISCDDTDRAFNIAFRTVAHDNKGLPHIFEHSTLAGSEKYPSSNLIFEMMNRTYTTFMNAMTYQCATMYPASSLSEDQLLANLDVYMSGVMNPILLTDERGLKREAFRYVLHDPDGSITPTGAVYNEMKGNFAKITYTSFKNTLGVLFPDSVLSYVTGGVPDDVLTVSWQELKDFHARYYHPSNMLITLYGKLDCPRFLKYLDENFLSTCSRTQITIEDPGYRPFTGTREATFYHPVTADSNPDKGSVLFYAIALNGMSLYDRTLMTVLNTAFTMDSFGMKKAFTERIPGSVLDVGVYDLPTPVFCFSLSNVNPEDKSEFLNIIHECLTDLAENGLDPDIIRIAVNSLKMKNILEAEDSGGISLICDAAVDWSAFGNPSAYLEECKAYQNLELCEKNGDFDRLIRDYLVSPKQCALTLTQPEPGGAERNEKSLADQMAAMKSAMSKQEILNLIAENKAFDEWAKENESVSLIDRVSAVSVQNLPEEHRSAELDDRIRDGIRFLTSPVPDAPYVDITLRLDASSVPVDCLHDYALFASLLGYCETERLSAEELEKQLNTYAYDYSFKWENVKYREGGHSPYLYLNVLTLRENLGHVLPLLEDILLRTKFTDYTKIRNLAAREVNERKNNAQTSPHILLFNISRAMGNPDAAYDGYMSFFDYWKYLASVADKTDPEMAVLSENLLQIRSSLLRKGGLTVSVIGCTDAIEDVCKFSLNLQNQFPIPAVSLPSSGREIPVFPRRLGILLEGNVQYNGHYLPFRELGCPYTAKLTVLFTLARSNFLLPELRFRHGAYSVFCSVSEKESYTFSYRDPELQNTFETYAKIADWLRNQPFSQTDLDGPIASCYSGLAKQLSPLNLAREAHTKAICNMYDPEFIPRSMKELKSFRPEDVPSLASVFDVLCSRGITISAGNASAIQNNKDRYDCIITDLLD